MKALIVLLVSIIAMVHAMTLDPLGSYLTPRDDDNAVTTTYPNGTTKVELYVAGAYVGKIIEEGDSGMPFSSFACRHVSRVRVQPRRLADCVSPEQCDP
jgi:hypothetical protein